MRISSLNLSAILGQFTRLNRGEQAEFAHVRAVELSKHVADHQARQPDSERNRVIDAEVLAKTVKVEALPEALFPTKPAKEVLERLAPPPGPLLRCAAGGGQVLGWDVFVRR